MAETEKVISQFTIGNETRNIADAKSREDIETLKKQIQYIVEGNEARDTADTKSREDIETLKKQIQYIAEQANINLNNVPK